MHSCSTLTPTRRLVTGSKAASLPPKISYLSLWTPVMTCIRPWAPTALGERVEAGFDGHDGQDQGRVELGGAADLVGLGHQGAERLRGHAVLLAEPVGDGGLLLGQVLGIGAVARSMAVGVSAVASGAGLRDSSQVASCASPVARRSGRAARASTTNTVASPRRAKPLCVISKKPSTTSEPNVRSPRAVVSNVLFIALPFCAASEDHA
jgi:hypothetical protein